MRLSHGTGVGPYVSEAKLSKILGNLDKRGVKVIRGDEPGPEKVSGTDDGSRPPPARTTTTPTAPPPASRRWATTPTWIWERSKVSGTENARTAN